MAAGTGKLRFTVHSTSGEVSKIVAYLQRYADTDNVLTPAGPRLPR